MSESAEITPEQVSEFQRRQQETELQRLRDTAAQIEKLAASLGVEIIGSAQLAEVAEGHFAIRTGWGVKAVA